MRPIKVCGLASVAYVALAAPTAASRRVAAAIALLGMATHLTQHPALVCGDVALNVATIAAVNATSTWQPQTLAMTLVALAAFAVSWRHPTHLAAECVHVALIQGAGALCLLRWSLAA